MTSALLNRTLALLRDRPRKVHLKDIAVGSGVGLKWLEALSAGKIDDPGVAKIEAVYCFMTGEQLNV